MIVQCYRPGGSTGKRHMQSGTNSHRTPVTGHIEQGSNAAVFKGQALAAAGAFFGHLFPVFFGFKGGKGVATALGVFLAINPFIALALALTWLTVAIIFRFSSLAAIISSASAPFWAWWFDSSDVYILLAFALAIILIWRHSENIKRLIVGTESKIGKKS